MNEETQIKMFCVEQAVKSGMDPVQTARQIYDFLSPHKELPPASGASALTLTAYELRIRAQCAEEAGTVLDHGGKLIPLKATQ